MTGRHRRPGRSTGRNLAATAAVLAAGALPLAAAGSAAAAAALAAGGPLAALPLSSPSLGSLPGGLGAAAAPLQGAVPLAGTAAGDVTDSVGAGDLPVGGLLGTASPQAQTRAAQMDRQAAFETAALASGTTQMTGRVASAVPVAGLLDQVAPAASGQRARMAPAAAQDGGTGLLAEGVGARTTELTSRFVGRMGPVVGQLHTAGVPTVGDVTSTLSQTRMPMFGTVGGLTSAVPVTQVLGDGSPVVGALGAASRL